MVDDIVVLWRKAAVDSCWPACIAYLGKGDSIMAAQCCVEKRASTAGRAAKIDDRTNSGTPDDVEWTLAQSAICKFDWLI